MIKRALAALALVAAMLGAGAATADSVADRGRTVIGDVAWTCVDVYLDAETVTACIPTP